MTILPWSSESYKSFLEAKRAWGNSYAYEEAWLYLCQALRKGGWVITTEQGWVAVARNYVRADEHALVVPLSESLADFVSSVVAELRKRDIRIGMVKHVAETTATQLIETGHFALMESRISTILDDISEDTLPQVLIRVDRDGWRVESAFEKWIPGLPVGAGAQDFRYQVRRFCRRYPMRGFSVRTEDLAIADMRSIKVAVSNWIASVRLRFSGGHRPLVKNFERTFVEPVLSILENAQQNDGHIQGELISVDEIPRAIWVGEPISNSCFGVYVLIADTCVHNLADYTLLRSLVAARDTGAISANLGGSELQSLFSFKAKPGSSLYRRVFDLTTNLDR